MTKLVRTAIATGAGVGLYALAEARFFRLQTHELALPAGAPDLDVLHVSDAHVTGSDEARLDLLASLPERLGTTPDLVLMTGDMIEDDSGIEPLLAALSGLQGTLGRFYVLGSHDYYQSRFKPPTRYFTGSRGVIDASPADTGRLQAELGEQGWTDLSNRTETVAGPQGKIRLAGVDDPYLGRHRTGHIARAEDEVLALGLTHAPDVVSDFILNGFDLVVCGHTHGGQVRAPLLGALVTNSSLPSALAMGPNAMGSGWLHVSPGIGTSRFTPIRFLCRPEVTLLRLRALDERRGGI